MKRAWETPGLSPTGRTDIGAKNEKRPQCEGQQLESGGRWLLQSKRLMTGGHHTTAVGLSLLPLSSPGDGNFLGEATRGTCPLPYAAANTTRLLPTRPA